jgi:hypothetical protein
MTKNTDPTPEALTAEEEKEVDEVFEVLMDLIQRHLKRDAVAA